MKTQRFPLGRRVRTVFATGMCLIALLSLQLTASGSSFGARVTAAVLFDALRDNGWSVRDNFSTGLIGRGESIRIRTTLHAGNTYKIAAAGCEDAYDVDIAVYDENGNLIDGDNDVDDLAVADVRPAWSGTFHIVVTMADSTRNGAHYVVQYAWHQN